MTPSTSDGIVVPENYSELQTAYGALICKLLMKYNKVKINYKDLHQNVWLRLVEAHLLDRFRSHALKQMPKTLTAIEACDLLGVGWNQWITAMGAYHKGLIKYDKNGREIGRKQGRWMPTPINLAEFEAEGLLGYSSKKALFVFGDIILLSYDVHYCANGSIRKAFRVMGQDVRDGIVYGPTRSEGCAKLPEIKVTKAQFRNYLTMAVLNHYANFCRTQERRHKERPYTPPSFMEEDAPTWEATLPDPQGVGADSMVALAEAKQMLSNTLLECMDGVSSCKPFEAHASEMFQMIEEGSSLVQALSKLDIPAKVRSAVLDTIRPLAQEFLAS